MRTAKKIQSNLSQYIAQKKHSKVGGPPAAATVMVMAANYSSYSNSRNVPVTAQPILGVPFNLPHTIEKKHNPEMFLFPLCVSRHMPLALANRNILHPGAQATERSM